MVKSGGVLLVAALTACATAPQPIAADAAILEAGDATLQSIDGAPVRTGNRGAFQLRPGGHAFEISSISFRPPGKLGSLEIPVRVSLCLKAKGGRRYRIKVAAASSGGPRVFVIDTATGEPPKTPCGPDEDDD